MTQVGAHTDAGVIETLDAVGQVGQGRSEGGVGTVTSPGAPADVLTGPRDDGASWVHRGHVLVADLGQDPLGPLGQGHRRGRPPPPPPRGAGPRGARPRYARGGPALPSPPRNTPDAAPAARPLAPGPPP